MKKGSLWARAAVLALLIIVVGCLLTGNTPLATAIIVTAIFLYGPLMVIRICLRYPGHLRGHFAAASIWTILTAILTAHFIKTPGNPSAVNYLALLVAGMVWIPSWRQLQKRKRETEGARTWRTVLRTTFTQTVWGPIALGTALLGVRMGGQAWFEHALDRKDIPTAVFLHKWNLGSLNDPFGYHGEAPRLVQAVWVEDAEVLTMYLAVSEDKNQDKEDALSSAVHYSDTTMTRLLLDHGASPNGRNVPWEDSPLCEAADEGNIEQARLLLSYGADRKATNSQYETAFQIAKRRGDRKMIALLAAPKKTPDNKP